MRGAGVVGAAMVVMLSVASRAPAQEGPPKANPKDVASADAIIDALYDANSILVDQKRDTARFLSLFIPDGRLINTRRQAMPWNVVVAQTPDQYAAAAGGGPKRHGFSEREIARTSQAFGSIMHVFSTYEARRDSGDTKPTRGINSIQLYNDGKRWWVVTVLWDTERPENPIPAEYLKRRVP